MELIDRFKAPTPEFWKKVRNIAGTVAVVGGAILTMPISLPVAVITAVTYTVVIAGTVAGTAQATKK